MQVVGGVGLKVGEWARSVFGFGGFDRLSRRLFQTQVAMCLGGFFIQFAGEFFLMTAAAEADAVRRCRRFLFLPRTCFFVIAGDFLELGDFYYIFVV